MQIVNAKGMRLSEQEARALEARYLGRIAQDCGRLEWLLSVDDKGEDAIPVALGSVYTALLVSERKQRKKEADRQHPFDSERPCSALEILNREARLVLTGAPGSGKSAFVNYLALCLAGEHLKEPGNPNNLETLTEALPKGDEDSREDRQPWDHDALIPVRVILRDFAASEHFPAADNESEAIRLSNFLKADLSGKSCADYFPLLEARLDSGQALVLFDGLDEVSRAGERRARLIRCIRSFQATFGKARYLVTCRPYAYDKKRWRIEGFSHAQLADFNRGQIQSYIERWYRQHSEYDEDEAGRRAASLTQAVLQRNSLFELAKRPLLLSLTAFLHANRHELPQRRADLYERLLDLLIGRWEGARFKIGEADEAREREQYSLAEFLNVGKGNIRAVLERLAFEAHAGQHDPTGTADIPAEKLINQLCYMGRDPDHPEQPTPNAPVIAEYLRDRVGILHQRGGDNDLNAVYTFRPPDLRV